MGRPADPTPHADTTPTHVRIRPTDTPLTAAAVEQGFQRLHGLATSASWRDRLRGSDPQPTIEWRLHTPAGTDGDVALYVGVTTDATETLHEALRTALPNEYELTPATPPSPAGESSADATTDDEVAAVEWGGEADRRDDWQTRLTPLASFTDSDDTRFPLASVAETLADTPAAVTYHSD